MKKHERLEQRLLKLSIEEELLVEWFRDMPCEGIGKNSRQYQCATREFAKNARKLSIAWYRLNGVKLRNPSSKHYKKMQKK